jgi:glycosyltransferase involved in cell wall biosynthesis
MRIAIIASPFISIPPRKYGGTELFIGELSEGLKRQGVDVVVYACGESAVSTEVRSIYPTEEWPIDGEIYSNLKDLDHTAWALSDAWDTADIVHLNNAPGIAFSRLGCANDDGFPLHQNPVVVKNAAASITSARKPSARRGPKFVYTIHHPVAAQLSRFYAHYPQIQYVTISRFQQAQERMPHIETIHHGVDLDRYRLVSRKQPYLSFIGRIAPVKGTHLAIEVAKRVGIPLKIAGEVQPAFQSYFDTMVKPHLDGRNVEFVGEADLGAKNELLGNSMAMLFPIQWNEPFGLVMIEAMATGTPVIALPGGSVEEVVSNGVSGWVCHSVDEMVQRTGQLGRFVPAALRSYVRQNFSVERMVRDYVALYARVLGLSISEPAVGLTAVKKHALSLTELPEDPEEPTVREAIA